MAITISGANNVDKILATDGVLDSISGFNVVGVMTAGTFDVTGKTTTGHLNIGSNIQLGNAGIITATTLIGNVTGNVNATSNLLLQVGGSEKFRVASSGQLGIGGANYGSSGQVLTSGGSGSAATWSTINTDLIQEGNTQAEVVDTGSDGHFKVITEGSERLRVSADGNVTVGAAVTISPVGNINATGIITATSFVGDGSNLTGITQTTINNNSDNRLITGSGTANTLNAEATLHYSDSLSITGSATPLSGTGHNYSVNLYRDGGSGYGYLDVVTGSSNHTGVRIRAYHNGTYNNVFEHTTGDFTRFYTGGSERLRITSAGQLVMGATTSKAKFEIKDNGYSSSTVLQRISGDDANPYALIIANDTCNTAAASGLQLFVSDSGEHYVRARASSTAGNNNLRLSAQNNVLLYSGSSETERLRITSSGRFGLNRSSPHYAMHLSPADSETRIDLHMTNDTTGHNSTDGVQFGYQNSAGAYIWNFENTDIYFGTSNNTRMKIKNDGTVQVNEHLTSRNGIVQINQVTSTTRYSGSIASVDLITGSTFTPKTNSPRFLIMIFCPVNTSDDSDAGGSNRNDYFYGRIEYRKNGGSWLECNDQGSTSQQGGYAAHISLSPNRTGNNSTDYWSGNRYRMAHKNATILVTNVGDCGDGGNVQFKLRGYSYSGSFVQIGQPHGNGTDDNYGVQPWGFTVFELAPDSNSYTSY